MTPMANTGSTDILLNSTEDNREVALELVRQARHEVLIASYDFDSRIYSNPEFIDALSAFVRSHRRAHVHIMVWKSQQAVKQGHRVADLAQKLSSYVKIHTPDRVHSDFIESFMVVDGTSYFRRPLADRHEGIASHHAPIVAQALQERFHEMWERSSPSTEFRRLGL